MSITDNSSEFRRGETFRLDYTWCYCLSGSLAPLRCLYVISEHHHYFRDTVSPSLIREPNQERAAWGCRGGSCRYSVLLAARFCLSVIVSAVQGIQSSRGPRRKDAHLLLCIHSPSSPSEVWCVREMQCGDRWERVIYCWTGTEEPCQHWGGTDARA